MILSLYGNTVAFDRYNNYTKAIGAEHFCGGKVDVNFTEGRNRVSMRQQRGIPPGLYSFVFIYI